MKLYILPIFLLLLPSLASATAIPADLVGVTGIGTVTGNSVEVKALVKGKAASAPYRLRMIPIQKQIIGSWLRAGGSAILRRSPYWIAATAAMSLLVSDTGPITETVLPVDYIPGYYWQTGSSITSWNPDDVYRSVRGPTWSSKTYSSDYIYYDGSYGGLYVRKKSCSINYDSICGTQPGSQQSITDEQFIDKAIQYIAANPSVDALTDPDNPNLWGHIEPQGLTYIPHAENGQDEAWVQSVLDGIAQSTDAAAPGYVPADQLARIEALAQQIAAGQTDQAQVDAMNDALTAPVTNASQAEADKAKEAAVSEALGEVPVLDDLLAPFDAKLDEIQEIPDSPIYQLPVLESLKFGGDTCYEIPYNMGNFGAGTFNKHCEPYYSYGLPLIKWALYIGTAIYCFFMVESRIGRRVA